VNQETLTEEEREWLDSICDAATIKLLRIYGAQTRELNAVYELLSSFPHWMCVAIDTEVARRAVRDEEGPFVQRLTTSRPPASPIEVALQRVQLEREELLSFERLTVLPPGNATGWIVALIAVGLIAMTTVGVLCGLRYYARHCVPGARERGAEWMCGRATEWQAP
jgi:hypothetical protein